MKPLEIGCRAIVVDIVSCAGERYPQYDQYLGIEVIVAPMANPCETCNGKCVGVLSNHPDYSDPKGYHTRKTNLLRIDDEGDQDDIRSERELDLSTLQ